jgi:hypothetical protein
MKEFETNITSKIYRFIPVEVFLKRGIIRAGNSAWLQQKLQQKYRTNAKAS